MKKLLIATSVALLALSFQASAASNTLQFSAVNSGGSPMTVISAIADYNNDNLNDDQVVGGVQLPKGNSVQDWGISLGDREDRRIANYSSFAGNLGEITAVGLYSDTSFTIKIAAAVFKASDSNWVLRSELTDVDHVYGLRVESNRAANSTNGSYSTNASVVPIPGAVWLFGSGMAGLLGLSRRKAKASTLSV